MASTALASSVISGDKVTNASLSVLTLFQNEAWYGYGFVVAAGLALFIAALRVNQRIEQLEYRTLCAQGG